VSVCLLASATEAPLPALGWAATFLFIAVERDVRERRIPNWLTVPAFCLFVAHGAWLGGASGAAASLLGAGLAFAILIGPYALGWFGAGDVKAMMALGALWGGDVFIEVLTWAILCGGGLALAWVAARGGLGDLCIRWAKTIWISLATRQWTYFAPAPGSAAAGGIPFGVAIGLGVAAFQYWGEVWA
jgi:Flp pilus assembly protein protease CpaA